MTLPALADRDEGCSAVRCVGLSHRYRGERELALSGLDLIVERGEIHALLGPNGSGKTTTVRILATLLSPMSGSARVLGIDVATSPRQVRRWIGVALQEVGLDPLATGLELLRLQGRLRGLRRARAADRASELLDLVGLEQAGERLVGTYSGGMRRRLDLACALVCAPALLLLDEPTTGLDPISRQGLWREIARLREEGTAILLTTQYLEEADRLADRISILGAGRLVADGRPEELKSGLGRDRVTVALTGPSRPAMLAALQALPLVLDVAANGDELTVSTSDGAALVPVLTNRLRELGSPPLRLEIAGPTLDDVFEHLAGQAPVDPPAHPLGARRRAGDD